VVTARPSHAAHKAASCAVNRATMLGWSSRLGLAEAGRSEPLAPRPTALPRAAATAALHCYHLAVVCTHCYLVVLSTSLAPRRCRCRRIVVASAPIRCTLCAADGQFKAATATHM